MKNTHPALLFVTFCSCFFFSSALTAAEQSPASPAELNALMRRPASADQAELQARKLMNLMTLEERFDFVCGTGFGIRGISRLGIPALNFADASAGLHLLGELSKTSKSTSFPCPLLLAATWDPKLAAKYAKAVAEEFRALGMHFILGPGMNIYRTSNNGRNFEYVGEDPLLASQIISSYVQGAQSVNVATTLKHFLCNETETKRKATSAIVDDRTLHEIYLPPFKAGVDAGAWAVMTSYNLLNGEWASQNKLLVTGLLRKQHGFSNLVMTDWDSTWYGTKLASSGTDLEMPRGDALKRDRKKLLGSPQIDRMVTDILKTGIQSGLYELETTGKFKKPEWIDKLPAHRQLALEVNLEGIVLLKNSGILPLATTQPGTILVTGNMADMNELAGGGSAFIKGYDPKNYLTAVEETFGKEHVLFAKDPDDDEIRSADLVLVFTGWRQDEKVGLSLGEHVPTGLSISEREDFNHPFQLPEDAFIARCTKLNPKTVVTLACANGVQMDWADQAAGIFAAFYGGQTGADALMQLITGKVNPSGKLPFTIERKEGDSPAAGEDALLRPGKNHADPKKLASWVSNHGQFIEGANHDELFTRELPYKEGIFVGYRWYDTKNIDPRFPFGHGLSYTTFKYSDLRVTSSGTRKNPGAVVRFKITNTGSRAGAEVAQVYIEDHDSKVSRPKRELKGFVRISMLPGETKEAEVSLDAHAFSYWHSGEKKWVVSKGPFTIALADSSRGIKKTASVDFQ